MERTESGAYIVAGAVQMQATHACLKKTLDGHQICGAGRQQLGARNDDATPRDIALQGDIKGSRKTALHSVIKGRLMTPPLST